MKQPLHNVKFVKPKLPKSYYTKCKERGYHATAKEAQNKGLTDGNLFYFLVFGKMPRIPF